ncbi:mitochondrial 54S ribosomal protein bL9m MRPL50 [Lachancea thermotolerans CBS 6340]|uniref:KLTH0A06292p n=1 Tax=Lachancea thermotolerans (strain ATCC 56472 / CBS 6340 / NRRL Y-8284) TaxID=559295 RepID=C5DBY3_LACTC|nr:KLTH0A06292p [Lachancea thermotolerans CBS 6340]CAR21290.1 KLTH0A06292p [Lachancea thermotolerans CBS 6340]
MFKAPALRAYSALSKRSKKVKVQLLKDFPQFQLYKGQVTQVSPSLMRNYLHLSNGARYILHEEEIDEGLRAESIAAAAARATSVQKAVKRQIEAAAEKIKGNDAKESEKTKESEKPDAEKQAPRVFNSGVTINDVKIPGLDI